MVGVGRRRGIRGGIRGRLPRLFPRGAGRGAGNLQYRVATRERLVRLECARGFARRPLDCVLEEWERPTLGAAARFAGLATPAGDGTRDASVLVSGQPLAGFLCRWEAQAD